ncbi:MAG: hypothetical protein ACLSHG_13375 [Oscillospiraceae bacterium]
MNVSSRRRLRTAALLTIENAAREPHIVDLANFLNSMGADIRGAGTDSIRIQGVERLHGGTYSVIPDQIEAGTRMAACAAAGGEVRLANVIPRHLECISAKLREMGVTVVEGGDSVLVRGNGRLRHTNDQRPSRARPPDVMCSRRSAWRCGSADEHERRDRGRV